MSHEHFGLLLNIKSHKTSDIVFSTYYSQMTLFLSSLEHEKFGIRYPFPFTLTIHLPLQLLTYWSMNLIVGLCVT